MAMIGVFMEIYLPMEKRVRRKVKIINGRIICYKQKRCGICFPLWIKIETTPQVLEYVKARLNPKEAEGIVEKKGTVLTH